MRTQNTQEAWLFLNHVCAMMTMGCINSIASVDCDKQISLDDVRSSIRKITAFKIDGKWQLAPIKSKVVKLLQKLNVTITNEELASALEVSSKL